MARPAVRPALAFHSLTRLYDRANDLLGFGVEFTRRVADALALGARESVIDVGCGTGTLLLVLGRRQPRAALTGIDADPQILGRARSKLTAAGVRATLAQADAQALPFPDRGFDAAVSTLVFHHLPTPVKETSLREIHRVLRPGGRFLLADFGRPQTTLQWTLLSIGRLVDGIERTRANLQGRLPLMLTEAGFQVEEVAERYRGVQFLCGRR